MHLSTLREMTNAVHLTQYVESPYSQRGGIAYVGPPASLKSSMLDFLAEYNSALVLSDINVQTMAKIRDDIAGRRITTLAFTDLEKLYQRHGSVASNIEGHIKGFADEGFRRASFEDQRAFSMPARCAIIACLTTNFYNRKISQWIDDGFARRFIWAHYSLDNPDIILEAIQKWRLLELGGPFEIKLPTNRHIPYNLTPQESSMVMRMLRYHRQRETPSILLKKMACVLKWKFPRGSTWKDLLHDFEPALGKDGAVVTL